MARSVPKPANRRTGISRENISARRFRKNVLSQVWGGCPVPAGFDGLTARRSTLMSYTHHEGCEQGERRVQTFASCSQCKNHNSTDPSTIPPIQGRVKSYFPKSALVANLLAIGFYGCYIRNRRWLWEEARRIRM